MHRITHTNILQHLNIYFTSIRIDAHEYTPFILTRFSTVLTTIVIDKVFPWIPYISHESNSNKNQGRKETRFFSSGSRNSLMCLSIHLYVWRLHGSCRGYIRMWLIQSKRDRSLEANKLYKGLARTILLVRWRKGSREGKREGQQFGKLLANDLTLDKRFDLPIYVYIYIYLVSSQGSTLYPNWISFHSLTRQLSFFLLCPYSSAYVYTLCVSRWASTTLRPSSTGFALSLLMNFTLYK